MQDDIVIIEIVDSLQASSKRMSVGVMTGQELVIKGEDAGDFGMSYAVLYRGTE